jgi:hypothetical protein
MKRLYSIPYTKSTSAADECVLYVARLHWMNYWWVKLIAFAAVGLSMVSPWFAVIAIPAFIWSLLYHYLSEIVLTNRRFVVRTGVFSNHIQEMASSHLDEIIINQTMLGRMLNYGDIIIHCKGLSEIRMKMVANPLGLHQAIERCHAACDDDIKNAA